MVVLIGSCTGSKKMVKKAEKLEAAGLYRDASEFFYDGLKRNPNNISQCQRFRF